jgi:hypothetical protein
LSNFVLVALTALGIAVACIQTAGVMVEVDFPPHLVAFFQPFFPEIDFQRVKLLVGLPWYLERLGFVAVTIGRDIYISSRYFDLCSPFGIAILGHELYHVHQGWENPVGFFVGYNIEFFTKGLANRLKNRFELPAYLFQYRLLAGFEAICGGAGRLNPCFTDNCIEINPEFITEWTEHYGLGFSERFFQIELPSAWFKADFGLSDVEVEEYQRYRPSP